MTFLISTGNEILPMASYDYWKEEIKNKRRPLNFKGRLTSTECQLLRHPGNTVARTLGSVRVSGPRSM